MSHFLRRRNNDRLLNRTSLRPLWPDGLCVLQNFLLCVDFLVWDNVSKARKKLSFDQRSGNVVPLLDSGTGRSRFRAAYIIVNQ